MAAGACIDSNTALWLMFHGGDWVMMEIIPVVASCSVPHIQLQAFLAVVFAVPASCLENNMRGIKITIATYLGFLCHFLCFNDESNMVAVFYLNLYLWGCCNTCHLLLTLVGRVAVTDLLLQGDSEGIVLWSQSFIKW